MALPTYPFERESYWVDADIGAIGGPSRGSDAAEPVDTSTNPDGELIPGTARFVDRVTDIVHTLSGIDKSSLDSSSTFLQLGFDSLFLSQVCRAIDREFDVAITFPQLAGQLTTIDAVAEHLSDECRPAEPSTAPTRVRETAPDAQSTRQTLEGIQV